MTFNEGIQSWSAIQKSVSVINHFNKLKKENYIIISIDNEKTFDKI